MNMARILRSLAWRCPSSSGVGRQPVREGWGKPSFARFSPAGAAFLVLLAMASLADPAARSREPRRFAWITGLKPEKAEYYRQLHANPWPGVNRMLKECHIQNYSIYEREIGGQLFLFSYLEYTGTDFDADMKRMAADPETQRWWKETDPCQIPPPDAAEQGKIWADLKEVYHLP